MLPAKISAVFRDSADVYLKAQGYRPARFGQRLLAQSFAGQTIQPAKVAAVTAKEIEAVSIGLVIAIKSVIEKFQINPYEGLESDLLAVFDSEFDKCAEAIEKFGRDISPACERMAPRPIGSLIDWRTLEKLDMWK